MADDELENDGSGKKPLIRYLLLGIAALIVVAVTVLATMFFVSAGPFDTDSASEIEETIQQLELDAEEARAITSPKRQSKKCVPYFRRSAS